MSDTNKDKTESAAKKEKSVDESGLTKDENIEENTETLDESDDKVKINPWGSKLIGEEEYVRLCEEFGIKRIEDTDIPASVYQKFRALRRKVIFGHRDFDMIIKAMQTGKPWAVMSGIKPSGKFHLGTMLTAIEMINLQKMGGFCYYAIADIESFEDNGMEYEETYNNAIDNLADMLALGLDPERCYVWLQSREETVYKMPFRAGGHVTNAMLRAIYGDKPFGLYLAALVQVGDILLPQLHNEPMPTVIPVGIDQDPHIRLTRDLTKYFSVNDKPLFKPSATYHKLMPGLDDITKKMNKSRPNSFFSFDESKKKIRKKIMSGFTGGRRNKEEQLELGGIPENCMIYRMMEYLFEDSDEALQDRYLRCRGGKLLCGTCKKEVATKVLEFIEQHNKKKEEMLPIAKQMLKHEEKDDEC